MRPSGLARSTFSVAETVRSFNATRATEWLAHRGTQTVSKATASDAHGAPPTAADGSAVLVLASNRMTARPAGSAVHTASGAAAAPGASPTGSFASGVSRVNGITAGFGGVGAAGVLFCATVTALPVGADSAKASTTAKVALRPIPRHHTSEAAPR